jgi:hypothetical protein
MVFSKKIIMVSPLILAGCLIFEDEQMDTTPYRQPVHNPLQQPQVRQPRQGELNRQAKKASHQVDEDTCCKKRASGEGQRQRPISQAPVTVSPSGAASQSAEWQPSDGQVVRAGELVMELKKNKGGANPSHAEMVAYLQSRMNLTSFQAEKVLDELGL